MRGSGGADRRRYSEAARQMTERVGADLGPWPKDRRAVEPLIRALRDNDWYVRSGVAEALGEMRDPRVVEPLTGALKDESWYVKLAAADALGRVGDARAVDGLVQTLKDGDEKVKEFARKALAKISARGSSVDS